MADDMELHRETCREWLWRSNRRCGERADFVLWGKLFGPGALGPRCMAHASDRLGYGPGSGKVGFEQAVQQNAVFDLRPLNAVIDADSPQERVRAREALLVSTSFRHGYHTGYGDGATNSPNRLEVSPEGHWQRG